jgi:S-ribosylhomocysteine lyase
MNTDEIHTIEHIAATYLRNDPVWGDNILYFGPMGCRTGFYLILAGDYTARNVCQLIYECFTFISTFEGDIPGASAKECGNYTDMNISLARHRAESYLKVFEDISDAQLVYPEDI